MVAGRADRAAPAPRLTQHATARMVAGVSERHLFVCTQARAGGRAACGARGGDDVIVAVQRELVVRKARAIRVTRCGCLGGCSDGPSAVVYPDGVWYGGLTPDDAAALVDHLVGGPPLARRRLPGPGEDPDDGPHDGPDDGAPADRGAPG